jgi:enoyl-CoA hydratase/carnithine racemase
MHNGPSRLTRPSAAAVDAGLIDYQTMFLALQQSPELREGMRAFMEKRPPAWGPGTR